MSIQNFQKYSPSTRFSRQVLADLSLEEMRSELTELEVDINIYLQGYKQANPQALSLLDCGAQKSIIEALRSAGHGPWSLSYDRSHVEIWGQNFVDTPTKPAFQIEFHRAWKVKCDWVLNTPKTVFRPFENDE